MSYLGFCLIVIWMVFVIGVGVAFLLWAWKQDELRFAASSGGQSTQTSKPEDVPQSAAIDRSTHVIVVDA